MIDLHNHIFYGLDDGAKDLEESVKMARIAAGDGIQKIVGTPHLFYGAHGSGELSVVEERRAELQRRLKDEKIGVEIYCGAEVRVAHDLIQQVRKNRLYLTIGSSAYMLIEFPPNHVFSGVKNLFFELLTEEIVPIIAHPERNSVFRDNPALLYELIETGSLAQANSGSFTGLYGRKTMEAAFRFLNWNFIQFVASDAHSPRSASPRLTEAYFQIEEKIGEERALALVWHNPLAVLNDEDIPYRYEPVFPEPKPKSARIKIPNPFWKN